MHSFLENPKTHPIVAGSMRLQSPKVVIPQNHQQSPVVQLTKIHCGTNGGTNGTIVHVVSMAFLHFIHWFLECQAAKLRVELSELIAKLGMEEDSAVNSADSRLILLIFS